MTVQVRFFALLRERAGHHALAWDIAAGATVSDLWRAVCAVFPALGAAHDRVAFAVNREYVDSLHPLHDNDEVAFIPPVSGGAFHVSPHSGTHRSQ